MFITRTLLTGAMTVFLMLSVAVTGIKADEETGLHVRLAEIRAELDALQDVPVDERQDGMKNIERELNSLSRQAVTPTEINHVDLLRALTKERRFDDPLHNLNYSAASDYRKVIARGGRGSLLGQPEQGWPDQYVEEAYENYVVLTEKIDRANQHKTMYKIVDFLVKGTGSQHNYSYWLAIVIITLVVKLITTPLSHIQFESMRNMQRIQPKLDKLRRELTDDPKELQRQQWQLMKDHNANPLMGCLPLLAQIPFLLLIYQAIRAYEFQFARGEFLWIGSRLTENFTFVAPSLADPDWPLLLLYGASMYISTKMSTPAIDPQQAAQQRMMSILMPAMFVLIFNYFPSAFILYWLTLNVLTTTQQYFMLKKPVPALSLEEDDEDMDTISSTSGSSGRGPSPRKRK